MSERPLFQARHFYWMATKLPWILYKAQLTLEQMAKVMHLLEEELMVTNVNFSSKKFRSVVSRIIHKVKEEQQRDREKNHS